MASKVIRIDRRQHPRDGIVGQLESITNAILRKYSITGEVTGGSTGGAASFVREPPRKFSANNKDKTVRLLLPSGARPFISASQHEPPEKRGQDNVNQSSYCRHQ